MHECGTGREVCGPPDPAVIEAHAQAEDQVHGMDADDLAIGEEVGQGLEEIIAFIEKQGMLSAA